MSLILDMLVHTVTYPFRLAAAKRRRRRIREKLRKQRNG